MCTPKHATKLWMQVLSRVSPVPLQKRDGPTAASRLDGGPLAAPRFAVFQGSSKHVCSNLSS